MTELNDVRTPLVVARTGLWWPWIALATGVLIVTVGGILFSHVSM